jgi:hypothetical protein
MQTHHTLPNIDVPVLTMDIDELMDVTARLADIMEEETKYLRNMEVDALAKLHEKKMELTRTMEAYQKILRTQPNLLKEADAAKLEQFSLLMEDFTAVVEENFRRTAVARSVNQRVVDTIIEAMSEQKRPGTYNRYGSSNLKQDMSLSLNLNHKA